MTATSRQVVSLICHPDNKCYCLRKLKSFDVRQYTLQMFYTAVVSSVLTLGMTCWGGNAAKQDRTRLDQNTKKAGGVVGRRQESIDTAYHRLVKQTEDIFG